MTLLATSDPDQGVWVDDTTIAVMKGSASESVTPELLSLTSSQPQQLAPWPGLTALSAGNGAEEIYAQSAEGIFQRLGNGWSPAAQGPDRSVLSGLAARAGRDLPGPGGVRAEPGRARRSARQRFPHSAPGLPPAAARANLVCGDLQRTP